MVFYNIGHTNDLAIIGHYPQAERTKVSGYHVDNFNSERNIDPLVFPNFKPNFGIDLHPDSKETDVIDRTTLEFGFIISEKLKNVLSDFYLPPHRFYPIDVYESNSKYYWFHYISDFESFFDAKNSVVEIFDIFRQQVIDVKRFNDYKELIDFNKKLVLQVGKTMRYKSIKVSSNFPNYDLFEIKGPYNFTLVSDKLKKELDNHNITGIEYKKYNCLSF